MVAAEARLAEAGLPGGGLRTGDFLDFDSLERFEVVIGNPPYVRYQSFAGVPRAKSRALALRYHVPLSGLASSWAAFTVHATNFLTDDGRLGLVLPAELLTVNYAAPVRSFLLRRFARPSRAVRGARVPRGAGGGGAAPGRGLGRYRPFRAAPGGRPSRSGTAPDLDHLGPPGS